MNSTDQATKTTRVSVSCPTRIHCGLINESGHEGRVDGGTGFSIDDPAWRIQISRGRQDYPVSILGLHPSHKAAVIACTERLSQVLGPISASIEATTAVPPHIGLGSKTSLLMAVAAGINDLYGGDLSPFALARVSQRGGTSGIGVHGSGKGGFLWDAGRAYPEEKSRFGPSSLALALPPKLHRKVQVNWIKVVHFRFDNIGVNGEDEVRLFQKTCPTSHEDTIQNLKVVSRVLWPALNTRNEALLHRGVAQIQTMGLKKAEWAYQQETTKEFQYYWQSETNGSPSLGLSSMGPTLYVLTSQPAAVRDMVERFGCRPRHFTVSTINNTGLQLHREVSHHE